MVLKKIRDETRTDGEIQTVINNDTSLTKTDGSRDFIDVVNGVTPTADNNLSTKKYVDENTYWALSSGKLHPKNYENIDLQSVSRIFGVLEPTLSNEVATKRYIDNRKYWENNETTNTLTTKTEGGSIELNPKTELGTSGSGTYTSGGSAVVIVPGVLELKRDSGGGYSYNSISETSNNYSGDQIVDTEWNTQTNGGSGWADISDVASRIYESAFDVAYGNSIGNNIVGDESIVHIISTDQYFKIKHTAWPSGGTGGFSVEWQEVSIVGGALDVGGATTTKRIINNGELTNNGNIINTEKITSSDLDLTSYTPSIVFKDTYYTNNSGLFYFDSPNTVNDRFRFHFGATPSDYPALFIQKQDIKGTDDVLFLGYGHSANSNFILESYKGKDFYVQTRNPLGNGDIYFATGVYGNSNLTNDRLKIDASTGNIILLEDNQKLLFGAGQEAGIWFDGSNLHIDAQQVGSGNIILDNLPTSSSGLPTGAVWNNGGVLSIV